MASFILKSEQSIHDLIQGINLPIADNYQINVNVKANEKTIILFETKRGTSIPKRYFANVYNNTNIPRFRIIQQRMKEQGIAEATVQITAIKKKKK